MTTLPEIAAEARDGRRERMRRQRAIRTGGRARDYFISDGCEWWLHPTKGWRSRRIATPPKATEGRNDGRK